ncbi:protein artichoke [Trichogramma pretiosum]|uniref:protein artichoke n=1 Tax=Trichogramma pretiosum TaxID=7493 RepID=UPI0006C997A3|nr:protein artichoke [Trichogramma pretiosum]
MLLLTILVGCILPALGGYIPPGPRYSCPKKSAYIHPCTCVRADDQGLYIECENSNLATLSVAFINLGNEGIPIEELRLIKCNIARFYGPALYPLNVRILKFLDTPLRHIEDHSFLGVNRTLQELHMTGTMLEKFPKEAMKILGNLTVLNIRGHKVEELPSDIFIDSYAVWKLERLEFSNGSLNSLPVDSFTPLKKLKNLDLHGNHIKDLKKNQFKGLRDVEALDLSYNLIDKIDQSHLSDLSKMGFLNLSNNAISDLKRGTFSRNSLLKVLNLNSNKIKKLDSNTFRGLRLMRRLYLRDNRIADVGRGTFSTMTRIGTIDLAKNMIKKVDYNMFYQLNYAEIIDVSENQVTVVEKLAFKDLFSASVNLSHNAISNIESGAFENCVNILTLDLSHNKLENISKTAFDTATYASTLQLSYNYLTSLIQVPLHNMTGLKVLNVSHNHLRSVPKGTFPKLYELHTIDLSYNNISDIYNTIFISLFSLRTLNLSHNAMERIKSSTFGDLPTLLDLDLSYNRLTDVSSGGFAKLASCRVLSVKHNQLTKIFQIPISVGHIDFSENLLEEIPTTEVWPSMNSLLHLDLSNNRLGDRLQHGSFQSLLTLRTLNLQSNGISKPPWEALSTLTSLQYVYLQYNNITQLNKAAFGKLPIVFELNLAYNQIQNVSERAFEGLLQLITLNLTSNDIQHIPNGAFRGLVSLTTLDLSHNQLEKLDNKTNGLLDDCLSLERVYLNHNKIAAVTPKTLPHDPWIPYKIKEVDLSYNLLSILNFDLTLGTKKVVYMNLSHNQISEIRRYVLGNMTDLQTLDLSYNEISDLSEPDVFMPPQNLTNLIFNHNRFHSLPWNKIITMPNLKVLDLKFNDFNAFDENIMTILNNGTIVEYDGNPLHCDCYVRPLRRWFDTFTEIPAEWTNIECASPSYVADLRLSDISEVLLSCSDTEVLEDPRYDLTPDVKYRDLEYDHDEGLWKVSWYVTSRGDTGDFYLVVREPGGRKNIMERDIVYKERSYKIRNLPDPDAKYELCVLARDSVGNIKNFRNSQCRILDKTSYNSSSTQLPNNVTLILSFVVLLLSMKY